MNVDVAAVQQMWRTYPERYASDALGVELWHRQIETLHMVRDNKRTAIASGHNIGKTFDAAVIINQFLDSYPGAMILLTAPTWQSVVNRIYRETRVMRQRARMPLGGRILTDQIVIDEDWKAVALSTRIPDSFQGLHAENVLIVFDEAQMVEPDIWDAAETSLSAGNARMLVLGNPIYTVGRFFDCFHSDKERWAHVNISCLEHPNIEAARNGMPIPYPSAVTLEWCDHIKAKYGERSPWYQSRVLGQFPAEGHDSLIPLAYLEQCANITPPGQPAGRTRRHMGVDLARFGMDESKAVLLDGMRVAKIDTWSQASTTESAARIKELAVAWDVPGEQVHVDVGAMGAGVVDILRDGGMPVDAVDFGEAPGNDWLHVIGTEAKIKNRRAALYWTARLLLRAGALSIPAEYVDLWQQLTSMRYLFHPQSGELMIEPKEDIRTRIGRSPDDADALVCALSRYVSTVGML